jgi:uncharacterized protein YdaU (DUF1376 family)
MHYFKRNIGDYHKKAGRLSMLEHGAYTLLMDACYDREQFPTIEQAYDWCWARTDEEKAAVRFVLEKFFCLEDGRYTQNRIQEEINRFHKNASINSKIAQEREEKRRTNRAQTVHEESTNRHLTINQEPITNNQEPIEKKKKKGSAPVSCPSDVDEKVWQDYTATRKSAITETALQILRKEAGLAGMTLEAVLSECTMRGWTGFKADWMKGKAVAGNRPLTVWEKSEQQKQEFSDRLWGRSKDDGRTIDATPLKLG